MTSQKHKTAGLVSNLIPQDVEYQAAHWLAVLDGDDPDAEQVEAFHQWKNQDPSHRKAFEALLELWGSANMLTCLEPPVSQSFWARVLSLSSAPSSFGRWSTVACGLLLAIAVSFFGPWGSTDEYRYVTLIGEQKTVVLTDGSEVILNTDTELVVRYDAARRLISLQKGEAHFEVAHDPQRPFDVLAGHGRVKALGTAFTVRLDPVGVSVYVTEGVVEVFNEPSRALPALASEQVSNVTSPPVVAPAPSSSINQRTGAEVIADAGQALGSVKVSAGKQTIYGTQSKRALNVAVIADMDDKLSWRQGKLVFKGEPLGEVINEFSRYTSVKIIVPSAKMQAMKIGGIFKTGDTVAMLDALKNGFGIHAQYVSDDIVYLVFEEDL